MENTREFKANDYVEVDNLYNWFFTFDSILEKGNSFKFNPREKGNDTLTVEEAQRQIRRNNTFFVGTGHGDYASLRIVDPEMRRYLLHRDDDPIQFTEERIQKMFACKTKETYKKAVDITIATKNTARSIRWMWNEIDFDSMPRWKEQILESRCAEFLGEKIIDVDSMVKEKATRYFDEHGKVITKDEYLGLKN